ncbi:MAG: DNA-3-methyladenine glycosylase family protein [Candidatus Neomarinimicrobiota bacterium]|tara:strand:- start:4872 stop:5456 length:585 start_codon:yes stop_codon:yes gene_type:complete
MIIKSHISFLSKSDNILKKVIKENKIPQISESEDYVLDLYKYIIFQQISTKAGNSIFNRFLKYYQKNKENITVWNEEDCKNIGLSHQKKKYIENIFSNRSEIYGLKKSNDINEIREKLIQIKGVGNWTIDMFLIFSKGNLDIFPEGDLALVNVIKDLYNVESMDKIREIASKWTPFKTIATLYLWESLDDDFPN